MLAFARHYLALKDFLILIAMACKVSGKISLISTECGKEFRGGKTFFGGSIIAVLVA